MAETIHSFTLDYEYLFSKTLAELMCEVFPAHGIDSMPDDEFDQLVAELTRDHFHECGAEFRRRYGLSTAPKIRMRW